MRCMTMNRSRTVPHFPAISHNLTYVLRPSDIWWPTENTKMRWARPQRLRITRKLIHLLLICLVHHGVVNVHTSVDLY